MRNVLILVTILGAFACKKKEDAPASKPVDAGAAATTKDRREPRHEDNFPRNKPGPPKLVDAKTLVDTPDGKKLELTVKVVDGWLAGGGTFKPAEADTIWYPRLGFEALADTDLDTYLDGKKKHWEVPNRGTGDPSRDGVRQQVDVVDQGPLDGGKFMILRVNKPAAEGPYPNIVTADCLKKRDGVVVHSYAWAPIEAEKTDLWPLLVEACKTAK